MLHDVLLPLRDSESDEESVDSDSNGCEKSLNARETAWRRVNKKKKKKV